VEQETPRKPNFEIRVGMFTLFAVIILFWGWSWLKSFSFHPPQRFTVQFHDIAGLNNNAPVQVNGVRVGTVEKIELRGKGQVLCRLKITTEDATIPEGSKVTIQTLGLVGAKYVEISFPEVKPDEPPPPPIAPETVIVGEDPVRTELYMNKIASNLSHVSEALGSKSASESLAKAAESSGDTVSKFKEAAEKFNKNMDKLSEATNNINSTTSKFKEGATSATGFFDQGKQTMQQVQGLAVDLRQTNRKVDKILGSPTLSTDFKDTVRMARDTADKIQTAMHELDTTLTDKPLRDDMITMLNKLATSTDNVYNSLQIVKTISNDQSLRSDMKEVLANAKEAMSKANSILGQDTFISDARLTMQKLRTAADDVDLASRNINQLLGRKRLLLHLMFGSGVKESSGKASPASKAKQPAKAGAVADKSAPNPDGDKPQAEQGNGDMHGKIEEH
jgi:ABC-type transporter Mla subunit MlaD